MPLLRLLRQRLQRFHSDTRGAISVLVLLTIWCLVGLIGLLWNTMEESRRRSEIQTAADTTAHAAAIAMARTGNLINAQNMVICQDASAETIWRTVPATDDELNIHFLGSSAGVLPHRKGEIEIATDMMNDNALANQQRTIQDDIIRINQDYANVGTALTQIQNGAGGGNFTPTERTDFNNTMRQIVSAQNWVYNTYVYGRPAQMANPLAPPRPGPPGPNGEGLIQIVGTWQPVTNEAGILLHIIEFINSTELPIIAAFERQTGYVYSDPSHSQWDKTLDTRMAEHEEIVYQTELAMVDNLPATIETQRQQIADFYKVDTTLATLKNSPRAPGPAVVVAPYMPASVDYVQPILGHQDSIRAKYLSGAGFSAWPPIQGEINKARNEGLGPIVDIDAANPNSGENRIWHPGLVVNIPEFNIDVPVYATAGGGANGIDGGWGTMFAPPLHRYFMQRVNGDAAQIEQTYMQEIDNQRQVLAREIRALLGFPDGNNTIANLPGAIPDDQPKVVPPQPPPLPGQPVPPPPPPVYDNIFVLPRLTAPANATGAFRTLVDNYNTSGAQFTTDVRKLRNDVLNRTEIFKQFTDPFAVLLWQDKVNHAADYVLKVIGDKKRYMVLSTYGLRYIPDASKASMRDSATAAIEKELTERATEGLTEMILRQLTSANASGLGNGILDPSYLETVLTAGYALQAVQAAQLRVRAAAHQVASEIADEWISRPWAYEITPPDVSVPPVRGILPAERMREFSVLAAARQTDAMAPKIFLPAIFGTDSKQLIAYAQGEMFNWMEFDPDDGAQPYDQALTIQERIYRFGLSLRYHPLTGAPREWRVASLAGWEWRARLSYSDSLYQQLQLNSDLAQYFDDAGIVTPSSGALDAVNLH